MTCCGCSTAVPLMIEALEAIRGILRLFGSVGPIGGRSAPARVSATGQIANLSVQRPSELDELQEIVGEDADAIVPFKGAEK